MNFLSKRLKKSKSTKIIAPYMVALKKNADIITRKRGNQIQEGLERSTASTGTLMRQLHGGAKKMAQLSNIGGGSKATGGGGVDEGLRAIEQYAKADAVKKAINPKNRFLIGE